MNIKYYKRLDNIPGIERFSDVLPVFASQEYANYLKEIENYSTIWFHGFVDSDLQFIIPLLFKNKYIFKTGMFLTATICLNRNVSTEPEREFLNYITAIIKDENLCDWIVQPPNWALFKTVPSNSIYCNFGTYRIDLTLNSEDELFNKINYHHKRLINKSLKNNVSVQNGIELIEDCKKVFSAATAVGNHTLLNENQIKGLFSSLPGLVNTYVSYNNLIPQSSIVYFYNKFCLYVVYIGNISSSSSGGNHLLHWQAILDAKQNGIKYFDFIGARMNPLPGSKQEGIQKFKKYFGGEFIEGYLWKMPINKFKYQLYNFLVRCKYFMEFNKYEGDIIDQELKRAKQ